MSIRKSLSSILTSTSSASGSTATVAAEVWMRPCASVAGTRWTRWTPLSNFSLANTPLPSTEAIASLNPATFGGGSGDQFDPPALPFGIALIHAEQVGGEQSGLVAPRPGTDFEHRGALVGGIAR